MSVVRTYLFSAPYAYIAERAQLAAEPARVDDTIEFYLAGVVGLAASVTSGEMVLPLVDYDAYERPVIELSARAVEDGTMIVPLVEYDAYEREVIECSTRSVEDGDMIAPLVTYDAYTRETINNHARSVASGTMTTS